MNRSTSSMAARPMEPLSERSGYRSRAHEVQNLYVSLKQWRILHAVIDCGGFAEAATHLHLSQSSISYTIAKLQERLGIQLLKIEGRKAQLTSAGRALLDRSRHVLKEALDLELLAKQLGQGWSSEVRLAVDQNFPAQLLMHALRNFSALGRGTYVRVSELDMPQAEEVLRDLAVDLAISERVPMGFLGEPLLEIEYVAVTHPDHPLQKLGRPVTAADLERQVQIGIGPASKSRAACIAGSWQSRHWNLSGLDTVIEAVGACLGYAWLPKHRIQQWLDQGMLQPLSIGEKQPHKRMLYLIHGNSPCVSASATRLKEIVRSLVAASHVAAELQSEQSR